MKKVNNKINRKCIAYFLTIILLIFSACIILKATFLSPMVVNAYTNTGNQIEDIVGVAQGEVGFKGVNDKRNKYTLWCGYLAGYPDGGYGYEWCQAFVGYCANKAGISTSIIPRQPGTHTCKNFFVNKGLWYNSKYHGGFYTPKKGDIIYFQWNGVGGKDARPSHVGIVKSVSGSKVYTIEGNTGADQVLERSYSLSSSSIQGYCTPQYINKAKNTVTIHYNANGGTVASDSNYYIGSNNDLYRKSDKKLMGPTWENGYKDPNGLFNASTLKLSRSGYTFLGWSLQKSGGKIYDQNDNSVSANDLFPDVKNKSGTVMLYAQWGKNTVTIHYNANGGTVASDSNYYIGSNNDLYRKSDKKLMGPTWENGYKDPNGLVNASTLKLSRSGYTFLGWSLKKSGGKIYDQNDSSVSANDLFPDIKTKSGTVTLYAQWEKNSVTMHYNANGGSIASGSNYYVGNNADIYTTSDKKVLESIWKYEYKGANGLWNAASFNLSRTGYKFLGWSLSKNGGKIYDQNDSSVSANDLFPDIKTKSGTVTLYAQWEKNSVTMHYNANGGSIASGSNYYVGNNADIYTTSDKKVLESIWKYEYKGANGLWNATSFNLSRTGYKFLGWSLSKSGGKIYDQDDSSVSANDLFPDIKSKSGTVTLYAQWEKQSTVTTTVTSTITTITTTTTVKTTTNTPKTTTVPPTTTVATKPLGDVNGDNKISVADVVLLQRYLVKKVEFTNEQWKLADLNSDGKVNVFDVVILKRKLLK